MSSESSVAVILESDSGKAEEGIALTRVFDARERTKRALKTLALFWGLAVVSVIFPLVHFVLVPGFLLAGAAVALWIQIQDSEVLGGEGRCPVCTAEFRIERSQLRWPLRDTCAKCFASVRIRPR